MAKLTIANKDELDQWMQEKMRAGRDIYSIKGNAPDGATYDDGTPITHPINVAWGDPKTGEVFAVEYDI